MKVFAFDLSLKIGIIRVILNFIWYHSIEKSSIEYFGDKLNNGSIYFPNYFGDISSQPDTFLNFNWLFLTLSLFYLLLNGYEYI